MKSGNISRTEYTKEIPNHWKSWARPTNGYLRSTSENSVNSFFLQSPMTVGPWTLLESVLILNIYPLYILFLEENIFLLPLSHANLICFTRRACLFQGSAAVTRPALGSALHPGPPSESPVSSYQVRNPLHSSSQCVPLL